MSLRPRPLTSKQIDACTTFPLNKKKGGVKPDSAADVHFAALERKKQYGLGVADVCHSCFNPIAGLLRVGMYPSGSTMFTRVTRSKSRATAIAASQAASGNTTRRGTRALTTSFKVNKGAAATKSKAAKVTASVKKTTRITAASKITTTAVNGLYILGGKGAATDNASTVTNLSATGISPAAEAAASPHDLLAQGLLHLRTVSPALAQWIDNEDYSRILTWHLRKSDDPPPNYFRSLARGIISQQVSGAAAASILRKFIALFYNPTPAAAEPPPEFFPTPQGVLDRTYDELRAVGLSERKAQYMHSLATEFIQDKSLTELHTLSNVDVVEKLTKVKGIGVWSAEMFLIFTLGRWDIFSVGDLGIQRGMAVWDGRDVNKLRKAGGGEGMKKVAAKWKYMSEEDMMRLSEGFKPWRSLFCLAMWKASDTQVVYMKEKERKATKAGAKRKGRTVVAEGEEGEEDED